MPKIRRTQRSQDTGSSEPNPTPAPSRGGRQRVYTSKKKENVIEQAMKETAAQKRSYVAAIRAEQMQEEARGFTGQSVLENVGSEFEEEEPFFSTITVPPPIKTVVRNGRTLVYRVAHKEHIPENLNTPELLSERPLSRHVTGQAVRSSPVMMLQEDLHTAATVTRDVRAPQQEQLRATPEQLRATPEQYGQGFETLGPTTPGSRNPMTIHQQFSPTRSPYTIRAQNYQHYDDTASSNLEYRTHMDPADELASVTTQPNTINRYCDSTPEPSSLGVRKSPPPRADADTTTTIKSVRTGTSGSRNRVRLADFNDFSRDLLEDAISYYRASIFTKNAFPERLDDRGEATSAFLKACQDRKVKVELEEDHLKIILSRAAQARGHVKSTARPLVEMHYNLGAANSNRKNRDNVENLSQRIAYAYKDPTERTGLYRHPIIQAIIDKAWFRNKTDDGVFLSEFSDHSGIPLAVIALVLTVVECCLDEWLKGEREDVDFSANAYAPKYEQHLARLKDFDAKTKANKIMPRLCQHLLNNAKKHAKVRPTATTEMSRYLGDADIEAAKKEWEQLVLSDSDGEE